MMTTEDILERYVKTATTHQARLEMVLPDVLKLLPMTEDKLRDLTKEQLMCLDTLTGRFAKLQDVLGSKIFPLIIKAFERDDAQDTIRDQLNKVEKLGALESVATWKELREIRNEIAHDYPDDEETIVRKINECATHCEALLKIWAQTKNFIRMKL